VRTITGNRPAGAGLGGAARERVPRFNCNLNLVGQVRGDGANWQTASSKTAFTNAPTTDVVRHCESHPAGRSGADVTNPAQPTVTGYLTTSSMLDPWNRSRSMNAATAGSRRSFQWRAFGTGGPAIDIYDLSDDCRYPQLLANIGVGNPNGTTGIPVGVVGHEGSWHRRPDVLRRRPHQQAVLRRRHHDSDQAKLLATWKPGIVGPTGAIANVHGLSISDDGTRGYFVSLATTPAAGLTDPTVSSANGLLIYDTSEIQLRKANPQYP